MALEFICSNVIENNKKIRIPEGTTHYIKKSKTRSSKTGRNPRINFFKVNPVPTERMEEIPSGVSYIGFDIEINVFNISYGNPCFYDAKGNVLNMEDY